MSDDLVRPTNIGRALREDAEMLAALCAVTRDRGEEITFKLEYVVLGAPSWPGVFSPHPPTPENIARFLVEHGGTLKRRLVTEWEDVR